MIGVPLFSLSLSVQYNNYERQAMEKPKGKLFSTGRRQVAYKQNYCGLTYNDVLLMSEVSCCFAWPIQINLLEIHVIVV